MLVQRYYLLNDFPSSRHILPQIGKGLRYPRQQLGQAAAEMSDFPFLRQTFHRYTHGQPMSNQAGIVSYEGKQ
jgi:hypothetical protein